MPSHGGQDQNPVSSPASRERGNFSQRSANKSNGPVENQANDIKGADNNKGESGVAGAQGNQHQILQNRRLKESTEQYQNDLKN